MSAGEASGSDYPMQEIEITHPLEEDSSPSAPLSFLDQILSLQPADGRAPTEVLERFLSADITVREALEIALPQFESLQQDEVVRLLNRSVGEIDALLSEQIDKILHHPRFQKLESTWRGLDFLVQRAYYEGTERVKIRAFNASWKDLERDFEHAAEFDQSQLFKKVYDEEFGTAGGQPLGTIIADYQIHPFPTREHPHNDLEILEALSGVGAAAFCPIITGAHPSMFGIDEYSDLDHTDNIERGFDQKQFIKWRAFRESEDARYVGLAMPHTLMRLPYDETSAGKGFCYREDVSGTDRSKYLWGNAAFALGEVLIRSFAQCGWLADIRGVTRNLEDGGLVSGLPVHNFGTDRLGVATKSSTDVVISDTQEAELAHLGFIPLCHCHDTEFSAFYSCPTAQKPKTYDRESATENAAISSMLQYVFPVARFAHYLKVLARDMIGSATDPEDVEYALYDWIKEYISADKDAKPAIKARRPLREAQIKVVGDPGKPGTYLCTFHLWPHYQLDGLSASIRMRTSVGESDQ
jgi:type VI secretion system ImpC/EvpB family protein